MRLRLLSRDPEIGWMPFAWLAFVGFFFVKFYFVDAPGVKGYLLKDAPAANRVEAARIALRKGWL